MTAPGRGRPQDVVERALAAAGGRDCAVLVTETSGVNLRWAMNGLTTNGITSVRSVTVVVAADVAGGTGAGGLTRQGIGPDEVAGLVAAAAALADASAAAEDAAPLAGPDVAGAGGGDTADDGDWTAPAAVTGADTLAGVAAGLGDVFARAAAESRESFGFAVHEVATTWLGTSAGLRLRHEQPTGTIELTGKSAGRTRSTWAGRATRDFRDVDALALDDEVRTRLGWQERRVELPAGRYDTVLPPSAVADLMIELYLAADARSAHEGRSVFGRPDGGTRVGERLTPAALTLRSDPGHPGLGCAPHVVTRASSPLASVFDNGLPCPPVTWIDRGVLGALPTTRHSARLSGLPFTPYVGNLVLEAADAQGSLEDLVRGTRRGLLLTSLWYIRAVDPPTLLLTGLTRDGVYVVEDGEVVGAATNFRFNESPVDLLRRVRAAGSTEVTLGRESGDWFPRTAAPPLLVEGFNMSTVSEAS